MSTISVRIEATDLAEARRYGINVSEACRKGLAAELRKARVAENVANLAKIARKPTLPSVEQIRRLRDGRAR